MKIAYVSHARFPTEKAHGNQIARVCEAMSNLGHDVTLLAPDVHNEVRENFVEYYGVKSNVTLNYVPTKDALLSRWIPGRFAMLFTMRSYRKGLTAFFKKHTYDLLYARSPHVLASMLATNIPVILELHTLPRRNKHRFVSQCKRCMLVVCLTSPMKEELITWGVPQEHILVEGDAVDVDRFTGLQDSELDLPKDKPVIGYVGSLVTMDNLEKGVGVLIQAVQELDVFTWIVGGPNSMVKKYRNLATSLGFANSDIRFEGRIPAEAVPTAIARCDVCVYPAPKSNHPFFMRDTSPLKLYEYLAAGVPIVCADIPPVRDIVDESVVWFFEAGNKQSLKDAITRALTHKELSQEKARIGKEIVLHHTWEKRMERIMNEEMLKT